jgi:hypothetical protein
VVTSATVHNDWRPEDTNAVLRPRRRARLLQPLHERRFTYAAYGAFLDRLVADERVRAVPLREFRDTPRDRVVVGLRHDVDDRLDSALRLARLEHERNVRSTYFVLHTAGYWQRPDLIARLVEIQQLGHEIGWHNDLVTLQVVYGVDAREFLGRELGALRSAGLDVRGTAAHGSYWGHALGYSNLYFFRDLPAPLDGFPNVDEVVVDGELRVVPHGTLAEFGFDYEAYHLDEDVYGSDSRFNDRGRRWHPDLLGLDALTARQTAIVLVHPCHWDASLSAKYARLGRRAARLLRQIPQARRSAGRSASAL